MIQILINRVSCSPVPILTHTHLRGKMRHKLAHFRTEDTPGIPCVFHKRMRLVLRKHKNLPDTGIHTIAQSKIDNTILASERNGWLGPGSCQRMESDTNSSGKNESHSVMNNTGFHEYLFKLITHKEKLATANGFFI